MIPRTLRAVVEERGWQRGNAGESRVAGLLDRFGLRPGSDRLGVQQQYRFGRYRLDFAWPHLKIALEADGWVHRTADACVRDRERDAWLRDRGWIVLRVDVDAADSLADQVARIVRIVRQEAAR